MQDIKIALCGAMRAGKDTVGEYLVQNYDFRRYAFGDGIRDLCREYFPDKIQADKKPRSLLQGVGQDLRKYDWDVWVKRLFSEVEKDRKSFKFFGKEPDFNMVITDLRQPNELEALKREDFYIVRVNVSGSEQLRRIAEAGDYFNVADLIHDTESHFNKFEVDYEITNNRDKAYLYEQIELMLHDIRLRREGL